MRSCTMKFDPSPSFDDEGNSIRGIGREGEKRLGSHVIVIHERCNDNQYAQRAFVQ